VCPLRCAADHSQERARSLRSLRNRIRRSGTLSAYPVRLVSGSTACGSGVPFVTSEELELQISDANLRMLSAQTPGLKRYYAKKVSELVAQRSPERIREMESALGLR
jgi:hypothetical protein